jgi:hypothetical protein
MGYKRMDTVSLSSKTPCFTSRVSLSTVVTRWEVGSLRIGKGTGTQPILRVARYFIRDNSMLAVAKNWSVMDQLALISLMETSVDGSSPTFHVWKVGLNVYVPSSRYVSVPWRTPS